LTSLPDSVEPPSWVGDSRGWPVEEVLAARNGLFRLPASGAPGPDDFRPPTPALFSHAALDYDYDPDAPPPAGWLQFLSDLWQDDAQSVDLLQEWLGYCLTPDARQEKILLVVGPKRSGKGTINRVATALVGKANVCNPPFASLATDFGLAPLLGKSLAIFPDARLSGKADDRKVVELLLSISGRDPQTVNIKHRQQVEARLNTRLMIFSNELPRLVDASGAFSSRFLLLKMTRSFYGQEDTGLPDRLLAELPGILRWAVEGRRRLVARGRFVQPASGKELLSDFEDISSPVGQFVREWCEVGAGRRVKVDELYTAWKCWCAGEGRQQPGTKSTFGRDLKAAVEGVRDIRFRESLIDQPDGRPRGYEGICLKSWAAARAA
jgi:putative DNA primase/helicase